MREDALLDLFRQCGDIAGEPLLPPHVSAAVPRLLLHLWGMPACHPCMVAIGSHRGPALRHLHTT